MKSKRGCPGLGLRWLPPTSGSLIPSVPQERLGPRVPGRCPGLPCASGPPAAPTGPGASLQLLGFRRGSAGGPLASRQPLGFLADFSLF